MEQQWEWGGTPSRAQKLYFLISCFSLQPAMTHQILIRVRQKSKAAGRTTIQNKKCRLFCSNISIYAVRLFFITNLLHKVILTAFNYAASKRICSDNIMDDKPKDSGMHLQLRGYLLLHKMSFLSRPCTWQLSRDMSMNAGFLCDKAVLIGDMTKATLCFVFYQLQNNMYQNRRKWKVTKITQGHINYPQNSRYPYFKLRVAWFPYIAICNKNSHLLNCSFPRLYLVVPSSVYLWVKREDIVL